jgi:hypothetical protein
MGKFLPCLFWRVALSNEAFFCRYDRVRTPSVPSNRGKECVEIPLSRCNEDLGAKSAETTESAASGPASTITDDPLADRNAGCGNGR